MSQNERWKLKQAIGVDGTENQGYFGIITQHCLTFSLQISLCRLGNQPAAGLLHIVCCCDGCLNENVPEGATLTLRFGQVLQPRREDTSIITPSLDLGFSVFDIPLRFPLKDNLMLARLSFKTCNLKRSDDNAKKTKQKKNNQCSPATTSFTFSAFVLGARMGRRLSLISQRSDFAKIPDQSEVLGCALICSCGDKPPKKCLYCASWVEA